ncbi:MAG: threonine synthase [Rhodospirillales bacterium]|nr:MAG: threonine synthase [Rhodospirillales bacterium]
MTAQFPYFVTTLECGMTGAPLPTGVLHNLSPAGYPIVVRYDLAGVKAAVTKDALRDRPQDMWRFRELLPVRRSENVVTLGEVWTPLVPLPALARKLGGGEILVKDEGRLPTGSFKTRGLAMAVSMAKELGVRKIAMPTNGNAGAALAAYATRAGIESIVLCPDDTPVINMAETELQGARLYRVNGLINDCGKIVGAGKAAGGWFDFSTLKEPYRIEGKKTMGLELAEQLGWDVPDVILYPTGGGTGLIGMWKAFNELEAMGWIKRKPRMVAVQATGCMPIVKAYESNARHAELFVNARTVAAGIRVPVAIGDFLILDAVRDSGGFAIAVDDGAIEAARVEVGKTEGLLLCPEGAATYAAYVKALGDGRIRRDERAMLFNCAIGLKYAMPEPTARLDKDGPIDYARL